MKNTLLYIFIGVVLVGCDDDDAKIADCSTKFSSFDTIGNPAPPKHPCDYLTAHKNGAEWTVRATTSYGFQNDTLYVYGSENEESLVFKFLFKGPGSYEIATKENDRLLNGNAYYYTTVGGDVIVSYYHLVQKSIIEIGEYNETEKTIKGTFKFSFKESSVSSTLSLEHGTFSVHLPD